MDINSSCSFCLEPNVIHCMNRSLYHKHTDEQQQYPKIIDDLIHRQSCPQFERYTQIITESDHRQFMTFLIKGKYLNRQYNQLLEYYKYRFYVPVFSKSSITERALAYYYQKLKYYYNDIKRKLNITIQHSQDSDQSYNSRSETNLSTKQELLKDLKKQMVEEDKKKRKVVPSIVQYKTQSKALEELVYYLKLNPKFQQVKTLKTEDCFEEDSIFRETATKKDFFKYQTHHDTTKTHVKTKLFKKILEGVSGKKEIPILNAQKSRERPPSRSKSIKIIKFKQNKEGKHGKDQKQKQKQQIFRPIQLKIKESSSTKTLPKRNSSLNRINQQHYSSPYERKAASTDKNKAVTTFLTKTGRSNSSDHITGKTLDIKSKTIENRTKTKQPIFATQVIRFQNSVPFKSTPSSPSSRKVPRPQIKVTKTDNILTIRKKKLQALKEKVKK